MWIMYVYGVLVVVTAIGALIRGAIWPGAAGLIGPLLCWWAGAGIRGSFMVGSRRQKIGGLIAGAAFTLVGLGVLYLSGYRVIIFSLELGGMAWGLLGTAVGFFCTTREVAEGRPEAPGYPERRVKGSVDLAANYPPRVSDAMRRSSGAPYKADGDVLMPESSKQQLSEVKAVRGVVEGLLADVDDAYPSYFEKIEAGELLGVPRRVFPMGQDAKYSLSIAFLSLELFSLKNLFSDEQSRRLIYLSVIEFSQKIGKTPDEVFSHYKQLEQDFNMFVGKLSDDATGIADRVYTNMCIPYTNMQGMNEMIPDPLVRTALSTLLGSSVGRWKKIRDSFELIDQQ
jgi:hypothetical protein